MSAKAKAAPGRGPQSQVSDQFLTSHNVTPEASQVTIQAPPLWRHIYGDTPGYISLLSGFRVAGEKDLQQVHTMHYAWPAKADEAVAWLERKSSEGREVYQCAHLISPPENKQPQRVKKQAALVKALYVDGDGATAPEDTPATAVVRSSPGRDQFYWQLTHAIEPARAEQLNKRLAYAMGADKSGWDLTQLLRPPGTPNRKYPNTPAVQLVTLDDALAYDPDELERTLPEAPAGGTTSAIIASSDDPPVRLYGDPLDWWTGKRQADNRSDTLWAIAKDLARAGAMPHTIAAAIQNRDETFHTETKYADRPEMYLETAINAIAAVIEELSAETTSRPAGESPGDATTDETCAARCAELSAQVNQLQAENAMLRDRLSRQWQVIRNPDLLPVEKVVGLAMFHEIESGKDDPKHLDEKGRVITSRAAIADRAGVKIAAVSRTVEKFEEWGMVRKDVVRVQKEEIDESTNETRTVTKSQWRMRAIDLNHALDDLIAFERPLEAPRPGGARPESKRCPDHPNAPIRVRRHDVEECDECGYFIDEIFDTFTRTASMSGEDRLIQQDSTVHSEQSLPEPSTVEGTLGHHSEQLTPADSNGNGHEPIPTIQNEQQRRRTPYEGEIYNPRLAAAGGSDD